MSTPLEKDKGLDGWIRVGVSLSASGDFAAPVVVVVVVVMVGVISIALTSRVPKRIYKNKKRKELAFKDLMGLGCFCKD